ncbi:hypothetical protein HN643_04540 [Candidatus Falkowbacteria bacterium]|jgi:hypothetical protein|nr:hypothetical protein [Candidatus Falkowbacteria bacterium]MBT5503291.1 hypothetical protein [Candidatus Falkowbacteria bacterium]MBT6574500.1 hypothetical protein [Candidatus Falkowbacteria bacterium]MBT7500908.1 hypothetical protein [Candidatus Falkowbacteria bacterium]
MQKFIAGFVLILLVFTLTGCAEKSKTYTLEKFLKNKEELVDKHFIIKGYVDYFRPCSSQEECTGVNYIIITDKKQGTDRTRMIINFNYDQRATFNHLKTFDTVKMVVKYHSERPENGGSSNETGFFTLRDFVSVEK